MTIGQRIRAQRITSGLTQKQLAEAVGLTESAIRNYERDIRTPKADQIEAIAKALDVAPAAIDDFGITNARQALEVVFRMEDELGLKPIKFGKTVGIGIDPMAHGAQKTQVALECWKVMRDDLEKGAITKAEYNEWKAKFKG